MHCDWVDSVLLTGSDRLPQSEQQKLAVILCAIIKWRLIMTVWCHTKELIRLYPSFVGNVSTHVFLLCLVMLPN